jgi:hypothetical protein
MCLYIEPSVLFALTFVLGIVTGLVLSSTAFFIKERW